MSGTPLYRDPALYDLIHAEGTADEVWLLDRLFVRHGRGAKLALEPACGTGRYLAGLLRRGWSVEGYDAAPAMVAWTRRRLAPAGARAVVRRGDMRSYRPRRRFGLVFNLLSTFRHLLSERDALAHLRLCRESLAPGGILVLGLDLAAYGEDAPDEEVYECRAGGRRARHVLMTLPPDRRRRRERVMNFVTAGGRVLESSYDLRSYDAAQLRALLGKARLRVAAACGYDGRPAELGGPERALWLVLVPAQSSEARRRSSDMTRREKPA